MYRSERTNHQLVQRAVIGDEFLSDEGVIRSPNHAATTLPFQYHRVTTRPSIHDRSLFRGLAVAVWCGSIRVPGR